MPAKRCHSSDPVQTAHAILFASKADHFARREMPFSELIRNMCEDIRTRWLCCQSTRQAQSDGLKKSVQYSPFGCSLSEWTSII